MCDWFHSSISAPLSNRAMKPIAHVRRERLQMLVKDSGGISALNVRLGRVARDATFSQILNRSPSSTTGNPKQMGDRLARSIEGSLKLPLGWMDTPIESPEGRQLELVPSIPTQETRWLLNAWQSASDEDKEIARFALSGHDAPPPPWAGKDMREHLAIIRYAALCWLRSGAKNVAGTPE